MCVCVCVCVYVCVCGLFLCPQDQHSIMCAWAIKDFAPRVKLHVQILHPENRVHLGVADHVVCEGELRNALLASNSVCPGISTLVSGWAVTGEWVGCHW